MARRVLSRSFLGLLLRWTRRIDGSPAQVNTGCGLQATPLREMTGQGWALACSPCFQLRADISPLACAGHHLGRVLDWPPRCTGIPLQRPLDALNPARLVQEPLCRSVWPCPGLLPLCMTDIATNSPLKFGEDGRSDATGTMVPKSGAVNPTRCLTQRSTRGRRAALRVDSATFALLARALRSCFSPSGVPGGKEERVSPSQ